MKEMQPTIFSFYKTMFHYQKKYFLFFSLVFGCIMVGILYGCIVPLVFKWMFDTVLYSKDLYLLLKASFILSISFILMILASLLQIYVTSKMGAKVIGEMRLQMFNKIQNIRLFGRGETFESDLMTRFTNDLAFVESMSIFMMWLGISSVLMTIIGTILLIYFDAFMTLVVALVIPFSLILSNLFSRRTSRVLKEKKQNEMDMLTHVQEAITLQDVIRLLLLKNFKLDRFKQKLSHSIETNRRYSILAGLTGRSSFFGLSFVKLLVLCGGGYFVVQGELSPGKLIGFIMLLGTVDNSITKIMSLYPILNRSAESLSKIQALIEEPTPSDALPSQKIFHFSKSIQFCNVSFGYLETPILHDLEFLIKKGMYVAFIGSSGCGKSTILKLILKEIEPQRGKILLDGIDYSQISQHSVLKQIGVVMQEPKLFETTIIDNIRMGKLDASHEEIMQAAKAAYIHEDIMQLPNKYETLVGKRNTGLSGGQSQRVTIARAILSLPPILCLDEATSALDPFSGKEIDNLLQKLAGKHTIISATHRLSSVVKADCIFVLDKGKIVETGTHEALLQQGGLYHNLWQKQQGFIFNQQTKEIYIIPEWLRRIPLFKSVNQKFLEDAAHEFAVDRKEPDEIIFKQNDRGEKFYILFAGKVDVIQQTETGAEKVISTLTDGDFFGEIALLYDTPRNATLKTKTVSIFLTLHYQAFHQLFKKLPESAQNDLLVKAQERLLPEQKGSVVPRF